MSDGNPSPSDPPPVRFVKALGTLVENVVVLGFIGVGFLMGKLDWQQAGIGAGIVLGLITIPQIWKGSGPPRVGVISMFPKAIAGAIEAIRHSGHG